MSAKRWADLVGSLRRTLGGLPDRRTGDNAHYAMEDIGSSAFSVFFTQSPSFLSCQKTLQQAKGRSNAQSLFQVEQIPCDNHIRQTLDPVPPEELFPLYDEVFESLQEAGCLESWRAVHDTTLLALDGTWYHSSQKIHCPNCSCLEHQSGEKTYYHSAVTPVIVAPGQPHAIPLRPEFITPQDGHTKQDCETAAAKRWLEKNAARYAPLKVTLLGDDLYAHQPFCRRTLLHDFHFIFVCKPDSHPTLYHWVHLLQRPDLGTVTMRVKVGIPLPHLCLSLRQRRSAGRGCRCPPGQLVRGDSDRPQGPGGLPQWFRDRFQNHRPECRRPGRRGPRPVEKSKTRTTTRSRPRAITSNTTSATVKSSSPRCWPR